MRANCTQVEKLQIKNVNKNKSVKHYYMERNADEKTKVYKLKDENGKAIPYHDPRTAKIRSKTFPGIAKAMAEQWAGKADKEGEK